MRFDSVVFGDVVQMISGKTPSKQNPDFWDGKVPWISASSMDKLYVSSSGEQITEKALQESGIKYIDEGTPLLLVRGSILHQRIPISIPTRKVTINQDVKALKLKNEIIDHDYFIAWLLASEKELLEKVEFTGIGAGKLDTDVLNKLSIPCPTKKHQQFIGKLSKAISQKIENNNQINESLENMAKAIFKEWFIDFGPVKAKQEGKKPACMDEENAALFPDSFEESELGIIPKGWTIKFVDELCTVTSSKRIMASEYVESGVPFYRSKEIINKANRVSVVTELFISESRYSDIKSKFDVPKVNDILITSVGTLGKIYRVTNSDRFYFKDGNLIWFKPKTEQASSLLYYYLNSQGGQLDLLKTAIGSTQPALTIVNLSKLKIVTPPEKILIQFHRAVTLLEESLNSNIIEIKLLNDIRDLLLPKLISGEIELSEVGL